jgi:hypothetical protein
MSKLAPSGIEIGINILSIGKIHFSHLVSFTDTDDPATDAGSPGGALSQVYILAEFMRRLKERLGLDEDQSPANYFDLFGGSGLGAYVPLLRLLFYCDKCVHIS